jgi:hypothetical protein
MSTDIAGEAMTSDGRETAPGLDRHLVALGAVVVLGMLMSILDTTIVNVVGLLVAAQRHINPPETPAR